VLLDHGLQPVFSRAAPPIKLATARSSHNALKTGLYSAAALLPNEDPEESRPRRVLRSLYKTPGPCPGGPRKIISDNVWCLRRIRGLVALQTASVSARVENDGTQRIPYNVISIKGRTLESFSRHEHRLQNAIAKTTLKLLKELQKEPPPGRSSLPVAAEPESGFVPRPQFATAAETANATQPAAETTENQYSRVTQIPRRSKPLGHTPSPKTARTVCWNATPLPERYRS
jgi:hypothetical protein